MICAATISTGLCSDDFAGLTKAACTSGWIPKISINGQCSSASRALPTTNADVIRSPSRDRQVVDLRMVLLAVRAIGIVAIACDLIQVIAVASCIDHQRRVVGGGVAGGEGGNLTGIFMANAISNTNALLIAGAGGGGAGRPAGGGRDECNGGGGIVNSEQERPPRPTHEPKSQIEQLTQQDAKLTLDQASDLLKVLQKAREVENKG